MDLKINKFLKNFDFTKKNIYVIGGSGLIGEHTSKLFSELNANVIILDLKKPKNLKKHYLFVKFDIKSIEKFNFENIFKKFGYPHVFINCSYPRDKNWSKSSFQKLKFESVKSNINLHLNSFIWTAKIFADVMVKKNIKGNIILLSSIYGFLGQDLTLYEKTNMNENAIYSAIKSGIINYVRQMASYYGKFQIRVNSISPGGIYGHNAETKSNKQNAIFLKNYSKKTPLSRLAHAEEIASSIIFLCSDNSSYTTGSNLIIDGGISSI